jgi:hypothetical protein
MQYRKCSSVEVHAARSCMSKGVCCFFATSRMMCHLSQHIPDEEFLHGCCDQIAECFES